MTGFEHRTVDADEFAEDISMPQACLQAIGFLVPLPTDFRALRPLGLVAGDYEKFLDRIDEAAEAIMVEHIEVEYGHFDYGEYRKFCLSAGLPSGSGAARDYYTRRGASMVLWRGPVREFIHMIAAMQMVSALDAETADHLCHIGGELVEAVHDFAHAETSELDWEVAVAFQDVQGTNRVCKVSYPPGCLDDADQATLLTVVMAALLRSGSLSMRVIGGQKMPDGTPRSTVRSWTIGRAEWTPLAAGEAFSLSCVDPRTGELSAPGYGVEHVTAHRL